MDSVDLINAGGILFTRTYTPLNQDPTLIMISKINESGVFQWTNSLVNKWKASPTDSIHPEYTRTCRTLTTDINGDITANIDLYRMYVPYIDTLTLTYTNGTTAPVYIAERDLVLKFSSSGVLLHTVNPYFLRVHNYADVTEAIKSVSDGVNKYTLIRITLNAKDTLNAPVPVPLNPGKNILLYKTDANDSIIWVKHIGTGQTATFTPPYISADIAQDFCLDLSLSRQELVLGFAFYEHDFVFTNYPGIQIPFDYNYHFWAAKFDLQGNITWNHEYPDAIQKLVSLTYNPVNNGLIMVLLTNGSSFNFGNLTLLNLPNVPRNRYFLAYLDTTNFCTGASWLTQLPYSRNQVIIGMYFATTGQDMWGIGNPISDNRGRTYLPGCFQDSIELNCKTYLKAIDRPRPDGFVMVVTPDSIITIDSAVCRSMVSLSGKYLWDSTGTYKDTILNHIGCDSIVRVKLTILQTKSSIDSSVCRSLKSPSGKYTWDSSATYRDTIPNAKGCDSVMTFKITILQTKNTIDSSVCKSLKSPSGNYTWDSSGTYRDTILNTKGCDSVMTFKVTILQTKSTIDTTSCGTYTSPSGKYVYDSTGIYKDTILNAKSCDSLITIRYTKLNLKGTMDTTTCGTILSPSGKYAYDSTGIYTDTLSSAMGCDSIITIRYTKQSTHSSFVKYRCDSLVSPSGKYTYTITGNYTDTISSVLSCDSIITIQLTILPLEIVVSKSNDISCDTPYTQLQVTGGNTFLWKPLTGLSDATLSNPLAKTDQKTIYHVIVKDTLGCSAEDSIEVLVNKQETLKPLANVFTPNSDGLNDCLLIESIGQLKQVSLSIFNRWGALVYETTNPKDCWNGKDKQGLDASAGTYYFIATGLSECDTNVEQRGTIQLIR